MGGKKKINCVLIDRELSKTPHMATTVGDEQTVQLMLNRWKDPETGLDQAWREEYMVYLSFPDPDKPNKVTVGKFSSKPNDNLATVSHFLLIFFFPQ